MKCSEVRKKLSPYMDGMIDGEEREKVEEHLESCNSCTKELKALKEVKKKLKQLSEVDAPEGFLQMIHARLEQESQFRRVWRGLFNFSGRRFPLELAAAVSMIVVAILLLWVLPLSRPLPREQIPIERAEMSERFEQATEPEESLTSVPEKEISKTKKTEGSEEIDAVGAIPESQIRPETLILTESGVRSEPPVRSKPRVPSERRVPSELKVPPGPRIPPELKVPPGTEEKEGFFTVDTHEDSAFSVASEAPERLMLRILITLPSPDKEIGKSVDGVSVKGRSAYERIEELVGRFSGEVVSADIDSGITAEIPAARYDQFLEELSLIGLFERPELHVPLEPTDTLLLSITVSP